MAKLSISRVFALGLTMLPAIVASSVQAQGLVHTLDNAYYKAYSAASLTLARKEDSTKAVADRMSKSPPTTMPQTPLPNVTYGVGGVTIIAGGAPIGAIGVSGAPGGQFDEACARAALAKIKDRMK